MSQQPFLLRSLFNGIHKVTLTENQIAQRLGIPKHLVREYIDHDIQAGMIFEVKSYSSYYLTYQGLGALFLYAGGLLKP